MSLEAWGDDGDADSPYTQERVDEIVAEAVAEARANLLRTLATALHKFAPELSLELTGRWSVAKGEAEAALQEFLAVLRPTGSGNG